MAGGWMIEVLMRDDEHDEEPISRTYAAHFDDPDEAEMEVAKYVRMEDQDDAPTGKKARTSAFDDTAIVNIEAMTEISESGLAFLALEPGKVARWT